MTNEPTPLATAVIDALRFALVNQEKKGAFEQSLSMSRQMALERFRNGIRGSGNIDPEIENQLLIIFDELGIR